MHFVIFQPMETQSLQSDTIETRQTYKAAQRSQIKLTLELSLPFCS